MKEANTQMRGLKPEGQGRMAALANELAKDPRPFHDLSPEERSACLEKVMGIGRGLMSTSEEFAKQKLEEVEIEDQKLARGRMAAGLVG